MQVWRPHARISVLDSGYMLVSCPQLLCVKCQKSVEETIPLWAAMSFHSYTIYEAAQSFSSDVLFPSLCLASHYGCAYTP